MFFIICSTVASTAFGQYRVMRRGAIQQISPAHLEFYSKYLNSGGIPIRSAAVVSDTALFIASAKLDMMLKRLQSARRNLIMHGAELHIIGKDQQTSDLPEFKHSKGVTFVDNNTTTDIDKRTRGLGSLYASCGEENLLKLPNDRYQGNDICIHEFAHTLMNFGLDSVIRNKIHIQYKASIGKGLWKGAYAATNEHEYWAELSTWYFGGLGGPVPGHKHGADPANWFRLYDADSYNLLHSIYTGQSQPALLTKKSRVVAEGTRSGASPHKSTLFIVNNSTKKLKISWIDWEGNSVSYGEVSPYAHFLGQETFYTHIWKIDDGKHPIYIKVLDPISVFKIDGNTKTN